MGVKVKNLTKIPIEDCQVWLSKVIDLQNNISVPIQYSVPLGWSGLYGTEKNGRVETPPLMVIDDVMPLICDIARTIPERQKATFRVPYHLDAKSPYVIEHGNYEVTIMVVGKWKGEPKHKSYNVILSFQSNDILQIISVRPIEDTP